MQNMGFWILNDVIWSKPNAVPNFGGTRFQNSHETLLWCTKNKNAKYTFNYKTMKYLNNDKQEKSVWNIGICIGNERFFHLSAQIQRNNSIMIHFVFHVFFSHQISRLSLSTILEFSSIKARRGSTFSPIRISNSSSASIAFSKLTCISVRF